MASRSSASAIALSCSSSSSSAPPLFPLPSTRSTFSPLPLSVHPVSPRTPLPSTSTMTATTSRPPRTLYHSHSAEEDVSYTPSSPRSPRANSPQQPRSVSPHGTRGTFMKKINKWKGSNDLDFGCAGDDRSWAGDGPSDLSNNYYSNRAFQRSSVGSSLPSLTHSRAHSSSSDHSISTVDSSLPPSPTPSCSSSNGGVFPPLPYCSRVPLTPRTAKRKSDEVAAIDALNEYFVRVRLSRVDEDVPSNSRSSQSTVGLGVMAESKEDSRAHEFEIQFLTTGHSTYTPLTPSTSVATFCPSQPLLQPIPSVARNYPNSDSGRSFDSGSNSSTIPGHSPIPDSEITGTLEELSEYFSRPPSENDHTPPTATVALPTHSRSSSTVLPQRKLDRRNRPRFASEGQMTSAMASAVVGVSPPRPSGEGRVPYGWI